MVAATAASAATADPSAWYVLLSRNSGKALDVYNLATNDGGRIIQWSRHDQANQQWQFVDSGGGYYYRIRSRHSSKVLDVYGPGSAGSRQAATDPAHRRRDHTPVTRRTRPCPTPTASATSPGRSPAS